MKRLTIVIVAVVALAVTSWLLLVSFGFFEDDLTGSVFIVTRGAQNVKFGLVEVRAIPEREILSFLQEKREVAKKEQDELQPLVEEAEQQAQEAEEEYRKADDEHNSYWTSSIYYFDGLPVGAASTKTDADGTFSLHLRRGMKYALAAKARREVIDDTEEYHWLVWVILDGNQTRVFLSNDNLLSSASSVVTATE